MSAGACNSRVWNVAEEVHQMFTHSRSRGDGRDKSLTTTTVLLEACLSHEGGWVDGRLQIYFTQPQFSPKFRCAYPGSQRLSRDSHHSLYAQSQQSSQGANPRNTPNSSSGNLGTRMQHAVALKVLHSRATLVFRSKTQLVRTRSTNDRFLTADSRDLIGCDRFQVLQGLLLLV
jgi:hypothetical protein